ncbi:polysaccharide export protein [Pseudooceanicola nitratireducens]|nr:polysaccharide export protein [Pseudooceanicola nitratireducens]
MLALIAAAGFLTLSGGKAAAQYAIQPGDQLQIEVLEDSSLNRGALVLPDGTINFPLVGTIRAAGQSVSQVRAVLTRQLASNFANEPNVFVTVARLAGNGLDLPTAPDTMRIYLMGEVNKSGMIEADPSTTLLQALAQAGGFSRFAAQKRIQLRRTQGGKTRVYTYNYKTGAGISGATVLSEGDVIVVPERGLFE